MKVARSKFEQSGLSLSTVLVLISIVLAAPSFAFIFGYVPLGNSQSRYIDKVQQLVFSPMSAAFGSTTTNTLRRTSFLLSNIGNDVATNVYSNVSGAHFRLYSTVTLGNISAARQRTVKVEYGPTAAGAHTGVVYYSAPNIPRVSRALSGTGVAGAGAACTTGTYVGGINPSVQTPSGSSALNVLRGQSFRFTQSGNLYSVLFRTTTAESLTLTCRIGTTVNLSTGYLAEEAYSSASIGTQEIIFTAHPEVTANTDYYAECLSAGGIGNFAGSLDDLPNGSRIAGIDLTWDTAIAIADDLYHGVTLCAD